MVGRLSTKEAGFSRNNSISLSYPGSFSINHKDSSFIKKKCKQGGLDPRQKTSHILTFHDSSIYHLNLVIKQQTSS